MYLMNRQWWECWFFDDSLMLAQLVGRCFTLNTRPVYTHSGLTDPHSRMSPGEHAPNLSQCWPRRPTKSIRCLACLAMMAGKLCSSQRLAVMVRRVACLEMLVWAVAGSLRSPGRLAVHVRVAHLAMVLRIRR